LFLAGSVERLIVARPLVSSTAVSIGIPPSRKVTSPPVVGFPLEDTMAVKVTLLPNTAALEESESKVTVTAGATTTMMKLEVEAAKFDVPP
jgi:hypothetical protein